MGAESSSTKVHHERKKYFSKEEYHRLLHHIRKLAKDGETVPVPMLEKHITRSFNPDMGKKFTHLLTRGRPVTSLPCTTIVDQLGPPLKGSLEERLYLTLTLAGGGQAGVLSDQIMKYTEVMLAAYVNSIANMSGSKHWKPSPPEVIQQISQALLHDLLFSGASPKEVWKKPPPKVRFSYDDFERWCLGHSIFTSLELEALKGCFPFSPLDYRGLLPEVQTTPKRFPTMLSAAQVMLLNSALPSTLQTDWRFLFSTAVHGWSFSIFMKQIVGKGPSVIVIEDQSGNKFGGFASTSWEVRPQFQGTAECFLFTLVPQTGIFRSTGFNGNYMYLNYLEKNTMPNGLGMGGREELFGFWLDYDFGKGTVAPTCTTFRSPPLSPHQELEIQGIEVWAVGPEEEDSDEEGTRQRSALDKNPDAQALLDMIGKTRVSEGLREAEESD